MSLIRKKEDRERVLLEHRFDGPGVVDATKITNSDDELNGKGRLYNDMILEKDCGVGFHMHEGDGEIYYIVSGEAEYEDTDHSIVTLHEGDVTITYSGEGHGITNVKDEPCRIIALILYSEE
ncbi:MAG: cupin domain-containing protein [Eggerthellaceae bacterium]|nr:cupin domain-containing protein [Eggerthellaceae bacterium]